MMYIVFTWHFIHHLYFVQAKLIIWRKTRQMCQKSEKIGFRRTHATKFLQVFRYTPFIWILKEPYDKLMLQHTKPYVVVRCDNKFHIYKTSQVLRIAALRVVGCQGVKGFSQKDVIITTSVTTVIFITITIWVFELSQFNFFSFVQFEFLSLVTVCCFFLSFIFVWVLEFWHNLGFFLFCHSLILFSLVNIR